MYVYNPLVSNSNISRVKMKMQGTMKKDVNLEHNLIVMCGRTYARRRRARDVRRAAERAERAVHQPEGATSSG